MCGLTGFWSNDANAAADGLSAIVADMAGSLVHRGPDDHGVWVDPAHGIALGFRRLAIVDLSAAGHQPMHSASGRFVIAYNGEIYNHRELRAELSASGVECRGGSDTEVMLEAFARWGIEATLRKLNGMFAIALWDRAAAELHLMRDPLGIKPLYWTRQGGLVLFGSELKALRRHPRFAAGIDRSALSAYLRLGYVPAPHSIYSGVRKLQPGCHLTFKASGAEMMNRFWNGRDAAAAGRVPIEECPDAEAVAGLETLLRDAVGRQMMADVPLGAFLSGGIDSSTVAALMQSQSASPIRTFTIGFEAAAYNEAAHARRVAAHLGTDHTEVTIQPSHALACIPRLPDIYDEPFADSSQLPTLLLSEVTRRSVTVALSGDGGDELLAGYERYRIAQATWQRMAAVPAPVRPLLQSAIRAASHPALGRVFDRMPQAMGLHLNSNRLSKLSRALAGDGPDALYAEIVAQWGNPAMLQPGMTEAPHAVIDRSAMAVAPDFADRMQLVDFETYLPDDILTKVDRASMAYSLEARVPLLDHRVVEYCWRLPRRHLVRDGQSKWLLRQVLYRYVPRELIERPKMGFGVPIGDWLRGPLREWAEDLLTEKSLADSGLVARPVRERWRQHVAGTQNWEYPLWTILMLQAWMRRWS